MGIPVPEEYGGAGADTLSYAIAIEELTRVDSSVAITVAAHTSLGTMPILLFGSEEQKREWLPDLAAGPQARRLRSDGARCRLRRGRHPDDRRAARRQWVVNGSKIFITNAGTDMTGCVTITARTGEDEISNLIVPNGTPGYEISAPMKKMGWRASDTRELSFTDCACRGQPARRARQGLPPVPRDPRRRPDLRGGDGRRAGAGRIRPRRGVRAGARAVRQADRLVPGRSASASPTWRPRSRRARNLVYKAAWLKDQGRPFALEAAMAKLYTGELSHRVVNWALQIHGGYGFMDEFADLAPLPRPEDPGDRRGHQRGAADGDREATRPVRRSARRAAPRCSFRRSRRAPRHRPPRVPRGRPAHDARLLGPQRAGAACGDRLTVTVPAGDRARAARRPPGWTLGRSAGQRDVERRAHCAAARSAVPRDAATATPRPAR